MLRTSTTQNIKVKRKKKKEKQLKTEWRKHPDFRSMQWKQHSLCVFTTLPLGISKITAFTLLWNCSVTYIRHYLTNNLAFPTCSLETNTYSNFKSLPLALKVYIFWQATNRGSCHLWGGFWNLLQRFKIKKCLGTTCRVRNKRWMIIKRVLNEDQRREAHNDSTVRK